jgi:hypothetical protein
MLRADSEKKEVVIQVAPDGVSVTIVATMVYVHPRRQNQKQKIPADWAENRFGGFGGRRHNE